MCIGHSGNTIFAPSESSRPGMVMAKIWVRHIGSVHNTHTMAFAYDAIGKGQDRLRTAPGVTVGAVILADYILNTVSIVRGQPGQK